VREAVAVAREDQCRVLDVGFPTGTSTSSAKVLFHKVDRVHRRIGPSVERTEEANERKEHPGGAVKSTLLAANVVDGLTSSMRLCRRCF
jgi:hypothetical protein